jgi:hypothetical protein
MNSNTRLEDITLNLTSATNGVVLKGIDVLGSAAQSAKLRTAVVNVSSTAAGAATVYGIYSAGTSTTDLTSSDFCRACTLNVHYAGTGGLCRGIYLGGANRINVRDTNIFVRDGVFPSTEDIIGCETDHPSAYLQIKTSSVYGAKADISQTRGAISIVSTELVNSTANGYGFRTNTSPIFMDFGVIGNFKSNTLTPLGYLMPGTLNTADVISSICHIPFYRNTLINGAVFSSTIPFTGSDHVHMNLYRYNSSLTASTLMYRAEINATSTLTYVDGISSYSLYTGDSIVVELSSSVATTTLNGVLAKVYMY